ncbi:MAG: hypothetical protein AB7E36_11970, partial [Salinivirgaceae bacterium]
MAKKRTVWFFLRLNFKQTIKELREIKMYPETKPLTSLHFLMVQRIENSIPVIWLKEPLKKIATKTLIHKV